MAKLKDGISLIDNHDFMTIKTANWSFTMSYSGEKASGSLVKAVGVFEKLCDFIKNYKATNAGSKNGDAMRALATKEALDNLWPEWTRARQVVEVGAIVRVPTYGKKYQGEYEVTSVKRAYGYLKISDTETIGFPMDDMVDTGKRATPVA